MARTTTTSRKPSKSPEERRAEMDTMQASIIEQVEALGVEGAWTRYLAFASRFHRYSLNNLLLILAQCPEATRVAGYQKWRELGRQVRKGERGIKIYGGRDVAVTREDPKTGEEQTHRVPRFFVVTVFDIGQTDPIEGADDVMPTQPAPQIERLTGEDHHGILAAVVDHLDELGWTTTFEPIEGETNGVTILDGSRRVIIDAHLSPAQAAKTALHEAAHVLMHAAADGTVPSERVDRDVREVEAESVAYVVGGLLGLDTTGYSIGYVGHWSRGDVEKIRATAAHVLRTAHALAEALAPVIEERQAHRVDDVAHVA